jgi:hypothetical protein
MPLPGSTSHLATSRRTINPGFGLDFGRCQPGNRFAVPAHPSWDSRLGQDALLRRTSEGLLVLIRSPATQEHAVGFSLPAHEPRPNCPSPPLERE